jgi:hypothetical protein
MSRTIRHDHRLLALGEEIWSQTVASRRVRPCGDCSVHAGCDGPKRHNPGIHTSEPAESSVLVGGAAGPHKIEGVGIGYTPPLWEPSLFDEIIPISTDDAKAMARRLTREEGLFGGTSSGANVLAAIQIARRLGPDAVVVTLMCDTVKYLSTDVYSRAVWVGRPRLGCRRHAVISHPIFAHASQTSTRTQARRLRRARPAPGPPALRRARSSRRTDCRLRHHAGWSCLRGMAGDAPEAAASSPI